VELKLQHTNQKLVSPACSVAWGGQIKCTRKCVAVLAHLQKPPSRRCNNMEIFEPMKSSVFTYIKLNVDMVELLARSNHKEHNRRNNTTTLLLPPGLVLSVLSEGAWFC